MSIILAQLTDTVENPGQLDICYHDPVVIVHMDKHIQLNKDLNLASRQYSCYHLIWCILNCWYCIYFLVTKYGAHANILCLLVRHVELSHQTLQRPNGRCLVSIAPPSYNFSCPAYQLGSRLAKRYKCVQLMCSSPRFKVSVQPNESFLAGLLPWCKHQRGCCALNAHPFKSSDGRHFSSNTPEAALLHL